MSKVPKLRFKEFSGEWNKERFGELCGFEQGVQVDVELQTKEQSDDLVRFIRIENYTQNSSDFRFIPKELAKKKSIDEKEIAIVRYGATAGFIGRGFNGVLANNLFKLKPNHKLLDDEYLYHYLKSYKAFHFFQSEMAGGAMPALSFGIVKALKLPYPSKQEQENIASFLTSIDTKIEQLTKKEQLLSSYKKGVMQKIFNQEIRFKADDGSEFCEWEEKKLGELCKLTKSGGTPTSTNQEYYDGDIPFLAISDITSQGKYLTYTSKTVSQKGIDNSSSWIVPVNTIIYSMYASVGFVSINKIPLATSQAVINLILKDEADTEFIYYYLLDYKKYIHRFIETGTQGNLNAQTVKSLNINLPCFEEQTKIADFLSSIDSKIEQVQKQLNFTKEFKKALLQQMFV
ncbi:EcoKI restriction-modification system protein HsdS [Arcobacter porcinus]|uniref:restriction endonuclease subunit S n=1 Tax=Arcobacter porcinus TaxID=1935204 RepID=UPI000824E3C2|nr:restriction endonuclease subunit S [Arcobacter porcinus]OCL82669.1 EcoKI restriction-modification system protein HsdS [Arcobacter porcinus]